MKKIWEETKIWATVLWNCSGMLFSFLFLTAAIVFFFLGRYPEALAYALLHLSFRISAFEDKLEERVKINQEWKHQAFATIEVLKIAKAKIDTLQDEIKILKGEASKAEYHA